jgi:clan AA aspartic protease (TIGR02281 family)
MLVAICCVSQTVSDSKAGEEGSGKESWRRIDETVIYRSNAPTKVTVIGNSVLVPVTVVYQGNQADVQLLLDTGASGTVINTEVADRLNVNLSTARKTRGRVVGGAVIEAYQVTLSRVTVGPHTKENAAVFVITHKGPAAKYDGLLGMDVLRGLKYSVDFEKQIILWE